MKITAAEEYGLRCLLNLARNSPDEQLSISEIAEKEGLSVPYASKLLAILRKAGLVAAVRGRGGGFSIAREPDTISLHEVLTALGGPIIDPNHCQKYTGQLEECIHGGDCSVQQIFCGLAGYVQDFLAATSIRDLIDGHGHAATTQSASPTPDPDTASAEEPDKMGNALESNTKPPLE